LLLPNFIFAFFRVEVSHVLDFSFQSNEEGRVVTSMVYGSCLIKKIISLYLDCDVSVGGLGSDIWFLV
jgi:hypothetical protein